MSDKNEAWRDAVAGQVERPVRPLEVAAALRAYQQGDMDGVMVLVSRQACDEGADWLERLDREAEVRYYEREHARARVDTVVKLLTGIHRLLYPAPITTPDGRTMVFRPKDPDPHTILQELSDRIRALNPDDETARLRAERDKLMTLTRMLDEHPDEYDGPCECKTCMSYMAEDGLGPL